MAIAYRRPQPWPHKDGVRIAVIALWLDRESAGKCGLSLVTARSRRDPRVQTTRS